MRNLLAVAAAVCLSLAAAPAEAHHSMAMFDMTKTITVVGTVREFQWTNPHCYIQLNAKDGKEWSMEMGAPMYLYSNGWRPKSVKPGDQITVRVYPLRDGKPGGVVIDVKTADGKILGKKG
ncbi:MAG: DUF6152 family protein [Candidatus Andeanibacterium colombiense]|uniref:DUF6152 family protein n=1 Tax=Candidatus Andeanibacterium colombiense TaxID=3121345 RepID=A0AAJ5X786_9SPHN|nr:MAG: DUF6152 family protein [Sphingomonadaceae bacterium]